MHYLNSTDPYDFFKKESNSELYVDKTQMIADISKRLGTGNRFICITRPPCFGKSINAAMLAAYYSKGIDSHSLFNQYAISTTPNYVAHLNKHNVIFLSLKQIVQNCNSFQDFKDHITTQLRHDLYKTFPFLCEFPFHNVRDLLVASEQKYIFILDDWDSIFYMIFMTTADIEKYLLFLENLLKNQAYVELAYMTGILPIPKYSNRGSLNIFDEFNVYNDDLFGQYFGFTSKEAIALCKHFSKPDFEDIQHWYAGYFTVNGETLFNPQSVKQALTHGQCRNFMLNTNSLTKIIDYIKNNTDIIRDDLEQLVSGNTIEIRLDCYSVTTFSFTDKEQILSAMVIYGLLSYHDNYLYIPNPELLTIIQLFLLKKF